MNNPNKEPLTPGSIRLETLQVTKVGFTGKEFPTIDATPQSIKFELEYRPIPLQSVTDKDKHHFGVQFTSSIVDVNGAINLEIEATAIFESDKEVNDDFLGSGFAKVNAPAIAFPYLRSFISTLTLNAGYTPVILPSVNFTKSVEKVAQNKQ
ncbi:protein-export chaperone SecB [Pontibacter roseus]|uniref:protein-export chaperone SecB n=1 Tax=Pontibacter roseus TaxID=336989 RepID=UPI00038060AC|nr:protein-export chaperone SecB [Pontibacter roseus]